VSNTEKGENPFDRKRKVSCALIISTGLVGPKIRPNWILSTDIKLIFFN